MTCIRSSQPTRKGDKKGEEKQKENLQETFALLPPLQTPFGRVTHPQPWPQGSVQANDPRGLSS